MYTYGWGQRHTSRAKIYQVFSVIFATAVKKICVEGLGLRLAKLYLQLCMRNGRREYSKNVVSSQSTNQIRPSEISRTANYSVSSAPDPLPHFPSVFFLRVQGGSGAETNV